jgi:hypothetical protein
VKKANIFYLKESKFIIRAAGVPAENLCQFSVAALSPFLSFLLLELDGIDAEALFNIPLFGQFQVSSP